MFPATVLLGVILLVATYWSTVDPYVGHPPSHTAVHVAEEAGGDHAKEWDENTLIGFTMVKGTSFAKATFMIYMQVAMLAAISVAVSTRMPMLLNLLICSGVFVLGHLTEYLKVLLEGLGKIPGIVGGILYMVVPNLSHFSIVGQKVAVGMEVSGTYILLATVYGVGYIIVALIFAFLLFRTREVG